MSVTVYSKPNCFYCDQAKKLLNLNEVVFDEVILDIGQTRDFGKSYMPIDEFRTQHPEAKSVPQVFIDDVCIGGFSELKRYLAQAA